MEERMQVDDGFNLVDLIKILLNKIKLLIIVVLCGGLAGAALAIWNTIDVNYYGTTMEFYINPESKDAADGTENISQYGIYGAYSVPVMDAMVRLLNSDSFTERLMLKGKPLPEKGFWTNANEATLGLDAKIDEAQAKIDAAAAAKTLADAKRVQAEQDLSVLQEEWKKFVAGSKYANTSYSAAAYDKAIIDNELNGVDATDLNAAFVAYESEGGSKEVSLAALNGAKEANNVALAAREDALAVWAKTAKYKQALGKYSSAVNFSYLEDGTTSTESTNLARSFVYVKITVLNDESFAKELLETIKIVVPTYIEERMVVPTGYDSTNCQRITRNDEIAMTNPGYTRKQALIYGLAGAAFAGLVACVIVIIADRSNKCLRNYEIIPRNFNVPILGVIPTIEEMVPTNDKNAEVKK
ncbi:MAG: hypothetical protein IKB20_04515 [Clostridia bacterium]|nr:hypothetical protein [Clostridia bacterium]